jgi:hypothetical protein
MYYKKGELVRKLKEDKANDIDIARAVAELKIRKTTLDNKVIYFKCNHF